MDQAIIATSNSSPTGHGRDEYYIIHKSGDSDDNFGLTVSSGGTAAYIDDVGDNTLTGSAPSTGAWQHIVLTFDISTEWAIYIDESKNINSTPPGSLISNTNTIQIGGRSDVGEWFDGGIDDVRVYDRALSASEVSALYQMREQRLHYL